MLAAILESRLRNAALLRRVPAWLAALAPWLWLRSASGCAFVIACVAIDGWRLHRRAAAAWPRWLDDACPEMEDSSALLVHADAPLARLQQSRLAARADALLRDGAQRRIARLNIGHGAGWAVLSLMLAAVFWAWQRQPAAHAQVPSQSRAVARPAGVLVLRVQPPAYTGAPAYETAPKDLQIPAASIVKWCVNDSGQPPPVELSDGQALRFEEGCARWTASESIFWRWKGARFNVRVVADEPPRIALAAPAEMLTVLARDAKEARIALEVRDDYRVVRATMHMTLARGSGENIRFSDREVPIPAGSDPRLRRFDKHWTLAELGMEPGDELYFFVRASDNADAPHNVQSPTYTLRLPGPPEEEESVNALPMLVKPESLRSQRQIIIDTEQLLADMKANPRMGQPAVRERSESIAADQATLRRRYGQFLGEESTLFGEEEAHHGASTERGLEAEYGHTHDQPENATLFDEATKKVLRRALAAMWDAEKALRAITPRTALPPEHKALEAIKELQQADRIYLHKTSFEAPPIKEDKRLTGDAVGAKGYARPQGDVTDPVPGPVRKLIQALATGDALPALWTRDAQDWIRARLGDDAQRLAAQRAVQDVADGCLQCRAVLRAWLRAAIGPAPVVLQGVRAVETPFTKAMQPGVRP